MHRHVHHAAALHAVLVAHRARRVHVPVEVPVIFRVGVDEAPDRAVLGGDLRLDAAPRPAVARDDDGAFHRDAQPVEHLVVLRAAVIDIHQAPGDVAVGRVRVIGRQLFGVLPRGRVGGDGRLDQRGDEPGGGGHLEPPRFRRRHEDVELLDLDLPSPLLQQAGDPLRVVLVVGRAQVVRPRRQTPHVLADLGGLGDRTELRVPALWRRGLSRHGRREQTQGKQDVRQTHEDSVQRAVFTTGGQEVRRLPDLLVPVESSQYLRFITGAQEIRRLFFRTISPKLLVSCRTVHNRSSSRSGEFSSGPCLLISLSPAERS